MVYGAVGCSASAADEFGNLAVESINNAMSKVIMDASYRQSVSHWFNIAPDKYQTWMDELIDRHYSFQGGGI